MISASPGAPSSTSLSKSQKWSNMTKVLQNLVEGQHDFDLYGMELLLSRALFLGYFHLLDH
jgi:hypothetical protein